MAMQHWGGDCESTYEAMAEATRGLLSLSSSGFGYGAHDIGGFEGLPPSDLYMRWVAFGAFSSHTRLHGSASYRVPWLYGEPAAVAMSKLLDIKHRIMPYIFNHVRFDYLSRTKPATDDVVGNRCAPAGSSHAPHDVR